jgi:hypothetical protein
MEYLSSNLIKGTASLKSKWASFCIGETGLKVLKPLPVKGFNQNII